MKTHKANAIKPQNQAESGPDMAEMPELRGVGNAEELTGEEMMMIVGGAEARLGIKIGDIGLGFTQAIP
ncbi:hypothetical protein [Scytonema sp. PCC 10023]|uniref:hypothetical protein n=1 Tax=Scytonema sp. PCC 10023 TaxID=1680591 RepID=UPI0039C5BDCA